MKKAKLVLVTKGEIILDKTAIQQVVDTFKSHDIDVKIVQNKEQKGYLGKITDVLNTLEVGDTITRKSILEMFWERYDGSITRSFDVYYSKYKSNCVDKEFVMRKGVITRTA